MFFKKKTKVNENIIVDFNKFNEGFAKALNLNYNPKSTYQECLIKDKTDRFNILGNFPLELLNDYKTKVVSKSWIDSCYLNINQTLKDYDINAKVVGHHVGAAAIRFDLSLGEKTKISKIEGLQRELKHNLNSESLTVDTDKFGIVIPIDTKSVIGLKDLLKDHRFQFNEGKLKIVLGLDLEGNLIIMDLTVLPHLLIAGATGGGKSVCVNTILTNLLFNYDTRYLRLILGDLKKVELTPYNNTKHLLKNVITNVNECISALEYLQSEIEKRQELFANVGCKNIETYNEKNERIYYIIFLIDEFSKLMINNKDKDLVEPLIQDIAERGRAFGIHLILTTLTPNADTITRTIKNNMLGRIAFKVDSREVSDMIIGEKGAENLLGNGDMYFKHNTLTRLQGAFIDENETERVTNYFKEDIPIAIEEPKKTVSQNYIDAGRFFIKLGRGSVTALRTIIKKYDTANEITQELIKNGVLDSVKNGNKGYKVLMNLEDFENHWRELSE